MEASVQSPKRLAAGGALAALMVVAGCTFPYEHRWLHSITTTCDYSFVVKDGQVLKGNTCYASELIDDIRRRVGSSGDIHAVETLLVSEDFLCSGDVSRLENFRNKERQRITCSILHQNTHPGLIGTLAAGEFRWNVEIEEQKGAPPNIRALVERLHKE